MTPSRSGLAYGIAAYLCWGFFPLYWPLLDPAGAYEVLAHRIVWSLVFVALLLSATGSWRKFWAILRQGRLMAILAVASAVIALNWGFFIYGVTNGHVIETSLGYFINPLVTVLLGVVLLKESLRPAQWCAIALSAVAVTILTLDYGRPPWIALVLAATFSTYGYLKKKAHLGTIEALGAETAVGTPFAIAFLLYLHLQGSLAFGQEGPINAALLAFTGVVTAIPLLLFGAAATRLRLSTIGMLQYLTPVLQFLLGLIIFGEAMTSARWTGFILVWVGLLIFSVDAYRSHRRALVVSQVC